MCVCVSIDPPLDSLAPAEDLSRVGCTYTHPIDRLRPLNAWDPLQALGSRRTGSLIFGVSGMRGGAGTHVTLCPRESSRLSICLDGGESEGREKIGLGENKI